MQELDHQIIKYQGRSYRYDSEMDCFYPYSDQPQGIVDRWLWLAVTVLLALLAWFIEQ